MHKPSLFDRLRYTFDDALSRGAGALIGLLALASVAIIVFIALIVRITGLLPDASFAQIVWMSLMRTLDAGTMGGDEGSWPFLLAMLAITIGGIFIISSLIGVLTTGLEARIEALRKGRSRVIEADHTVILGWSEQVFPIIQQLVVANENRKRPCIVILGDLDKVEMEDQISREGRPHRSNAHRVPLR